MRPRASRPDLELRTGHVDRLVVAGGRVLGAVVDGARSTPTWLSTRPAGPGGSGRVPPGSGSPTSSGVTAAWCTSTAPTGCARVPHPDR